MLLLKMEDLPFFSRPYHPVVVWGQGGAPALKGQRVPIFGVAGVPLRALPSVGRVSLRTLNLLWSVEWLKPQASSA